MHSLPLPHGKWLIVALASVSLPYADDIPLKMKKRLPATLPGGMFFIRLGYILIGITAAYLVNCLLFPYSRAKATRQLWEKYKSASRLPARMCRTARTDPQLYYHLVIQVCLKEEKLKQNASLENRTDFPAMPDDWHLNLLSASVSSSHNGTPETPEYI